MTTIDVGDPAPEFTLPAHDGTKFALEDHRGSWVVVYFYPKDFTPGCTKEACGFRDLHDDFVEAGAAVVGISSDLVHTHDLFAEKYALPFPLLSDTDDSVRAAYGVAKTFGMLPGRVTFVIDPDGIVRHVFNSQFRATRHPRAAIDAIRAGA